MTRNKGAVLTKVLAAMTASVVIALAVYYGIKWKQNHEDYVALLTQEQDFNKKIGDGAFADADIDRFVSVSDAVLDGKRSLSDADLGWCLDMIRQGPIVPNSPDDRRLSYRCAKMGRTMVTAPATFDDSRLHELALRKNGPDNGHCPAATGPRAKGAPLRGPVGQYESVKGKSGR